MMFKPDPIGQASEGRLVCFHAGVSRETLGVSELTGMRLQRALEE